MHGGAANLAYLARGVRMYGARPVLARSRGFWELQWIFRGEARPDRPGGGVFQGSAPCLYISHPDSRHGWTDEEDGESEVFVLHFRAVSPELAEWVKPAESLALELGPAEHRQLAARLNEVWEMSRGGDLRLGLKLEQILVEVALLVLGRGASATVNRLAASRVERALHWFEENLGENPTVDDVACAVGVSAAHLRRIFAEEGCRSPRAELARLRMAAAQRCLREGWKQDRVARFLGFSDASAFSRAFSAECGLSPRRWLSGGHAEAGSVQPRDT